MLARPLIAIDVDDVLAEYVPSMCSIVNEKYGLQLCPSDYGSQGPAKVWGCSEQEASNRITNIFRNTTLLEALPVVPGAIESIAALKEAGAKLIIITARPQELRPSTEKWLATHFPKETFDEIHLTGQLVKVDGKEVYKNIPKAKLLEGRDAVCLIDDLPVNVIEAAGVVGQSILFRRPCGPGWSLEIPPGVCPVEGTAVAENWDEVLTLCLALIRTHKG